MLQKLIAQSLRTVFAPRPDISKASELVLTLNLFEAKANSGSPEFFVREVIPFRVLHPKNKKVAPSMGYEFVGCVIRRPGDGMPAVRSKASLVCWKEAWKLLEKNKPFTVVLCEHPKKRSFAHASRRGDCASFNVRSLFSKDGISDENRNLMD